MTNATRRVERRTRAIERASKRIGHDGGLGNVHARERGHHRAGLERFDGLADDRRAVGREAHDRMRRLAISMATDGGAGASQDEARDGVEGLIRRRLPC
jgi:hypothetical protein